jgi:LacI family transcriptional regulator
VCFNDAVAFGVMDAVAELDLRLGTDVKVIGFDDVNAAASSRPSLSSVAVHAHRAGALAAGQLLNRVGGATEAADIVLQANFNGRESCGCPHVRESA